MAKQKISQPPQRDRGRKPHVLATITVYGEGDRFCEAANGGLRSCCRWLGFGHCELFDPDNERDLDVDSTEDGDEIRLRHPSCVKATKAVSP